MSNSSKTPYVKNENEVCVMTTNGSEAHTVHCTKHSQNPGISSMTTIRSETEESEILPNMTDFKQPNPLRLKPDAVLDYQENVGGEVSGRECGKDFRKCNPQLGCTFDQKSAPVSGCLTHSFPENLTVVERTNTPNHKTTFQNADKCIPSQNSAEIHTEGSRKDLTINQFQDSRWRLTTIPIYYLKSNQQDYLILDKSSHPLLLVCPNTSPCCSRGTNKISTVTTDEKDIQELPQENYQPTRTFPAKVDSTLKPSPQKKLITRSKYFVTGKEDEICPSKDSNKYNNRVLLKKHKRSNAYKKFLPDDISKFGPAIPSDFVPLQA